MKTIVTRLFTFDSIRKKIFFSLVLIVVIPVMIITALFYSSSVNIMEESLSKSIMNSLDIANHSMDKLLSNMMIASNLLTFDNEILEILEMDLKGGKFSYDNIARLDSKIFKLEMVSLIPGALRVSMTNFYGNYYTNWFGSDVDYYKKYTAENWYKKVKELDGYIQWLAPQQNYISEVEKERSFISLARVLKKERKGVGTLLVSIYEDKFFNNIFMTEKLFQSSNTFVLSNEAVILSASDKSLIGKDLSGESYIQNGVFRCSWTHKNAKILLFS